MYIVYQLLKIQTVYFHYHYFHRYHSISHTPNGYFWIEDIYMQPPFLRGIFSLVLRVIQMISYLSYKTLFWPIFFFSKFFRYCYNCHFHFQHYVSQLDSSYITIHFLQVSLHVGILGNEVSNIFRTSTETFHNYSSLKIPIFSLITYVKQILTCFMVLIIS